MLSVEKRCVCFGKNTLTARVHLNRGKVYIRHILTHWKYDKGAWKQ